MVNIPQLSLNLVFNMELLSGEAQVVKGGQTVKACKIADPTGSVELSLWSPWCEVVQVILVSCGTAI